jgi:hypothetical protein
MVRRQIPSTRPVNLTATEHHDATWFRELHRTGSIATGGSSQGYWFISDVFPTLQNRSNQHRIKPTSTDTTPQPQDITRGKKKESGIHEQADPRRWWGGQWAHWPAVAEDDDLEERPPPRRRHGCRLHRDWSPASPSPLVVVCRRHAKRTRSLVRGKKKSAGQRWWWCDGFDFFSFLIKLIVWRDRLDSIDVCAHLFGHVHYHFVLDKCGHVHFLCVSIYLWWWCSRFNAYNVFDVMPTTEALINFLVW